jgi:predicted dehydrogenase
MQIEEFLTAYNENRQPMVTSQDALRAVELISELYKSAGLRWQAENT